MSPYPNLTKLLSRFDPNLLVEPEDYTGRQFLRDFDAKQQNALRREINDFLAENRSPKELVEFWNRHCRMPITGRSAAFSIHVLRSLLEKLEQDHEARFRSYAERWHPNSSPTDE